LKEIFNGVGDFPEGVRKKTHYLGVLTSPISYLTSVPIAENVNNLETTPNRI
jgi:hypothetical protein